MKIVLTSWFGHSYKSDDVRYPKLLSNENQLSQNIHDIWPEKANILMICSDPTEFEDNDDSRNCFKQSCLMNGLNVSQINICDNRNPSILFETDSKGINVLIFVGGHVPTQNAFFKKIGLKEYLRTYDGIIIAWSAGSMNCADIVYVCPELEGEAIDPTYNRWIPGLGLTDINIMPHYQYYRDECVDGFRMLEDLVYLDSYVHDIIGIPDGSYILIDENESTIYGEASLVRKGEEKQICSNNNCIIYKGE